MSSGDKKKEKKLRDRLFEMGSKAGSEDEVKKRFLDYFKKNKRSIGFGQQVEKIYDLLISGQLNTRDKAIIVGALLYFINPFDLIPDITPILGFLDDMSVIALAYRYLTNRSMEMNGDTTSEAPKEKDDSDKKE